LFPYGLEKAWNVHIGDMIKEENIIPGGIIRRFKDIFMADPQYKIPNIRPDPGHRTDQVTSPAPSEK
jgi:hypothetical protein